MSISRRKTVLALVEETTEGVPVKPTLVSQYTPLQDGFSMTPSFNVLQNTELKSSIGKGKNELGSEAPEGSVGHYIKASGVEGTDVDYKVLLKSAFGARNTYGVEYDTIAASTTLLLKVDVGEGVNFPRGRAVLIKDPVNGYQIRNSLSVAGDDITVAQKLKGAPALGVQLGKCVSYVVADEGHPTMTVWQYLGNGGAIEMMAGARVTEMSISATAGEYINGQFSFGGVSYFFNPIQVTATDVKLDFLDNATTRVATIAAGIYKDPHQLADAIATAMNSLGSGNTFTCVYDNSAGKFTITSSGATLTLKWNTGANTANTIGDVLGFSVAADDSGSQTYTSDNAQDWAAPQVPDFDDSSANVAKSNEVMLGGVNDITCFKAQTFSLSLSNTKTDIPDLCEDSGKSGSLITERSVTAQVTYLLTKNDAEKFRAFREGSKVQLTYNFGQKLGGQWAPGKCVNIFCPTMTITSLEIQDSDGLCVVNASLQGYVEDGLPELYLNFV
jgi:hypothetical protein